MHNHIQMLRIVMTTSFKYCGVFVIWRCVITA